MFVVVCYDIPDDGRRLKVARYLEGWGMRVQRSVFECAVRDHQALERLVRGLGRRLDGEEDRVRVYHLCERCRRQVRVLGPGEVTEVPPAWVV